MVLTIHGARAVELQLDTEKLQGFTVCVAADRRSDRWCLGPHGARTLHAVGRAVEMLGGFTCFEKRLGRLDQLGFSAIVTLER